MAKAPAVAKSGSQSTAVVSWQDKLASMAVADTANEKQATGMAVSFKAGQVSISGQPVAGNKLDAVIVGDIYENAFYTSEYDSENPQPPVCFAFGSEEEGMAPHADSAEPQHSQCKGCPNNEWGSAAKGKGKACKNIRRIALVSANNLTVEGISTGEMAYAKLPVTSGAGYSMYKRMLKDVHSRPAFAVVTSIGTVPDPKSQFKVTFAHAVNIQDEDVGNALMEKHEQAYDFLAVPYQAAATEEKPKKPAAKGARKF